MNPDAPLLWGPQRHQAFVMSHTHANERPYFERHAHSAWDDGLFEEIQNDRRLRARMKVKNRREERQRFREDWDAEIPVTPRPTKPGRSMGWGR